MFFTPWIPPQTLYLCGFQALHNQVTIKNTSSHIGEIFINKNILKKFSLYIHIHVHGFSGYSVTTPLKAA
nr:MAG TPA: hypothetical protein [Caudoviricetes sp.]